MDNKSAISGGALYIFGPGGGGGSGRAKDTSIHSTGGDTGSSERFKQRECLASLSNWKHALCEAAKRDESVDGYLYQIQCHETQLIAQGLMKAEDCTV